MVALSTPGSLKFKDYLDLYQVSHLNFKDYCLWRAALGVVQYKQRRSSGGLATLLELKKKLNGFKSSLIGK